jgi:iron complex outermembrane recepter protein
MLMRINFRNALLSLTMLFSGHAGLFAEGPDSLFLEPDRQQVLPEVMVSAFNQSRRLLDAPGSVSMIGASVIEREHPVTLLPLISQASGVFAHAGTLSTSRITIRGIGARVPYATGKIRAYFGDIPLTNGSGVSIVEHIDPAVTDRIEITKGPGSSAYGAGLGGTINMVPRQPGIRGRGITTSFEAGSYGLSRSGLVFDAGKEDFHTSVVYNRSRNDGYRENNKYRRDVITAVLQWQPATATSITGLFAYSDVKGEIPSSIDSVLFVGNPRAAAANWEKTNGYEDVNIWLAGVSASHAFHPRFSIDMALFSTFHNEMEMRPFDVLHENRYSGGARLKANYNRTVQNATLHLTGGGEWFFEHFGYKNYQNIEGVGMQGELISNNLENISNMHVFVQGDLEMANVNLSFGMNLHDAKTDYNDLFMAGQTDRSAIYRPGLILSPRVGANVRYLPYQAVFFCIGHGFSTVSLSETLTPEGFVNMEIRPEKSWNYEVGTRGSLWGNRVFYDLNLYQMMVTDLLVAERIGADAWVGKNAGASSHRGVEAEVQAYLIRRGFDQTSSGSWWQAVEVSLKHIFSYNHFVFTDFVDYGMDYAGNHIPGIPSSTSTSTVVARLQGGFYGMLKHRYVGSMPMNDMNSREAEAYQLLDMTLGYKTFLGKWVLDAYLGINNIFDQHYASMILVNAPSFGSSLPRYYYPGLPRNISSGLRMSFRF